MTWAKKQKILCFCTVSTILHSGSLHLETHTWHLLNL